MRVETFEERMKSAGVDMDAFWQDCRSLFGLPTGKRVLSALVAARNPLTFPRGATDSETFAMNGQREVVATLFRSLQTQQD